MVEGFGGVGRKRATAWGCGGEAVVRSVDVGEEW